MRSRAINRSSSVLPGMRAAARQGPRGIDRDLSALLADASDAAARVAAVRAFKELEFARIALRDFADCAPVRSLTAEFSDLADAVLCAVYDTAFGECVRRYGRPLERDGSPAEGAVVAMGKLGGRELNYCSDIDLIVVYSDDGMTEKGYATGEFFDSSASSS